MDYEDNPLGQHQDSLQAHGRNRLRYTAPNPVATIIGNAMMGTEYRNSVIIAPHPMSVRLSVKMVKLLKGA